MVEQRSHTRIIIVGGAGTIGSSTALHLVRSGYISSNITVLDVYPIPSAQSAGNDLNKIMSIRTGSAMAVEMSLECLDMWKGDPLFMEWYHRVGMFDCSATEEGIGELRTEYQELLNAGRGLEKSNIWLDSEEEIVKRVGCFTNEQVQGWKGVFCEDGGWMAAGHALDAVGTFLKQEGVAFRFGEAGTFRRPLFADDEATCNGVETADGSRYFADKVVMATGAWTPKLIELEDQCVSKAWVIAHIQVTAEEAAYYRQVPVVYDGDYGFFFEPDKWVPSQSVLSDAYQRHARNGLIKVCDEFPGFSHYEMCQPFGASEPRLISVPRSHAGHPTDTYPDASEVSIRKAVARFLPALRDREFVYRAMCWCTDTADANLLICEHPKWKNLILATGDSGHSFKLLPSIGKHVVSLLEGTLREDYAHAWRWRPGTGDASKSRRAAPPKDLADLPGWKHDAETGVGRTR